MSNNKSLDIQEKAKKSIPGMSQLLSKRPDQFSLGVWPGYFQKAKGVEVWDLDGNRYIDMSIGGIGANVLGYADPDVDSAVLEAIKNGVSSSLNCPEEVQLAQELCRLHPWAEKARFSRAGGEAMVIAVRIARAHTGREFVAFCGYHGWHDWYLAANLGETDALDGHLMAGLSPTGVPRSLKGTSAPFHYNRLDELQELVSGKGGELAAIVMESIRSQEPSPEFLAGVRKLADETGAVLVVDEISAGFRLNTGGAHLTIGLEPDIAVFSKALGNGYAVSAIIGRGDVMESAQKTFISSTNWTERVGPAAALATLAKHERVNAGEHLVETGLAVQNGWKSISKKYDLEIDVSGIPPLSHFSFAGEQPLVKKAFFVEKMLEKGFLASNLFYAMYAHSTEHVESYLAAVDEVFERLVDVAAKGRLESELKGRPARPGFTRIA